VNRRQGGSWWRVAPERIDRAVGRDDLVDVQKEQGKECSLVPAAERQTGAGVDDLDRAEDPELHRVVVPASFAAEQGALASD
jgi:hypothetical protein